MKMPWARDSESRPAVDLVKTGDLDAGILDSASGKQLIRAIAKRDQRIARRIESLQETNAQLVRQNEELSKRTEAVETALARLINGQGLGMVRQGSTNEGGELVRGHMRDVDRHVL